MKSFLSLFLFVITAQAWASPRASELEFKYQDNFAPWEIGKCKHQKVEGPAPDWDVTCDFKGKIKKYTVHLVVNYYPKTNYGESAHEILYWVTDRTNKEIRYDSSTIWLHANKSDSRATMIQLAQGVENDMASLRLEIRWPQ